MILRNHYAACVFKESFHMHHLLECLSLGGLRCLFCLCLYCMISCCHPLRCSYPLHLYTCMHHVSLFTTKSDKSFYCSS